MANKKTDKKKSEKSSGSSSWDPSKHPRSPTGEFTSVDRGDGYKGKEDKKDSVKQVQDFLIEQGLLDEDSGDNDGKDGLFGPKTEAALKEWQQENGYKQTGRVTPWTMKRMMGGGKKSSDKDSDSSNSGSDDSDSGGKAFLPTQPLVTPEWAKEDSDSDDSGDGQKAFLRDDREERRREAEDQVEKALKRLKELR